MRTQATYSFIDLAGVPPDIASTLAKVAKPATGTKSCAGLKPGFFTTCGRMEMLWSCERNKVWPSAGAAFSACAAIWPPAPPRFSTTTGAPSSSLSFSASSAGNRVGAAAGRKAHQDADGRAALRLRDAGQRGQRAEGGGAAQAARQNITS